MFDSPTFANLVNRGINTQCTGIIIPIMKYTITSPEIFHFILPMANETVEPRNMLSSRVMTHTKSEFTIAMPSFPAVHAKT